MQANAQASVQNQNVVTSGGGGWGGDCTCPDGEVYQVGDGNDGCATMACIGGTPGTCHKKMGEWTNRKVICATALWPQLGENHRKCTHSYSSQFNVVSQLACQSEAVNAGHEYYQFYAGTYGNNNACATAATCASPTTGTSWDWRIYHQAMDLQLLRYSNILTSY